jgi:hypothetical protein
MHAPRSLALLALVPACAADPQYIHPDRGIEVDPTTGVAAVTERLSLPFDAARLDGAAYRRDRQDALIELNARVDPDIADDQFPLVRLDQLALSIEWSIENLSDQPGVARIHVNGGNQYFAYVPGNFVLDPDDDEVEPPPLAGDIPIAIAARGTVTGVIREDTLREAALDLELITRGGINPFAATLVVHEDIRSTADVAFTPYPPDQDPPPTPPPPLPIEAFGHLVRIDLTFEADRHMILEYVVRARDPDRLLHDELRAAPAGELYPFAPADYAPAGIP